MKHFVFLGLLFWCLASCKRKSELVIHESSRITSLTNDAEQQYLDENLLTVSNVSPLATEYLAALPSIKMKAEELKLLFKRDQAISISLQKEFIDTFAHSLKYLSTSDSTTLDSLRQCPITNLDDIDQLLLFMKRIFVYKASGVDRYFFNTIGTSISSPSLNIKKGEEILLELNLTAANSLRPAEWFLLKDGGSDLTAQNILDTLYSNGVGTVKIKRKVFQVGENSLTFAAKIPSSRGKVVLYKSVYFTVR